MYKTWILFFICIQILVGCGEHVNSTEETRLQLSEYLKTVEKIDTVTISGEVVNVHILLDSTNLGCDEEWNFRNARMAILVSSNEELRKLFQENRYTLQIERATHATSMDYKFSQEFTFAELDYLNNHYANPELTVKKIDYITNNFTYDEYHQVWVILDEFHSDSITSGHILFSKLYLNCQGGMANSCKDYTFVKNICKRVEQDTAIPVYISLNRHFENLDSVK